jgi:hypothetical protein
MSVLEAAVQGLSHYAERVLVPWENRRLSARVVSARDGFARRIEAAIDRGIAWFAGAARLEFDPMFVLHRLHEAGLEPRLGFVHAHIAAYRARCNDPGLRVFDRCYDPDDPAVAHLPRVTREDPILQLMIRCIYADRLGLTEGFLDELAAIDDRGGYGTTHIVVGGTLLKSFGRIPHAAIDALLAGTLRPMIRAQRTRTVGDQFAERVMVLQWLGRHDAIEPAWIARLLDAQRPDGGWAAHGTPAPASNQHTSTLALAALVQYRAAQNAGTA